nr:putative FBD-associated F-box protein At5g50270 isoform X1 [Lolium perenne]
MEDRRRQPGGGKDRISGLPDELLHVILRCLRSAPAAARTSALSRRWRRVWAHRSDLVFGDDLIRGVEGGGISFLDALDAALAAYSDDPAVHVGRLKITVPRTCGAKVTGRRVAPWLRFASRRLAGTFYLFVPYHWHPSPRANLEDDELELPPSGGATVIDLRLGSRFHLHILPAGTFAVLADLKIHSATVVGRELEVLVSSQCPRLRNLDLVVNLLAASDIAVRSSTLRRLKFYVLDTRRLHIAAPMLEVLDVSQVADAHIAAPNLVEVLLSSTNVFFADTGRHLRRLAIMLCSATAPLMRRLDSVNYLQLQIPSVTGRYRTGWHELLPKCEILCVSSSGLNVHAFEPFLLHLLRKGNTIRKLLLYFAFPLMKPYCSLDCPCRLPVSPMTNKTILDSLEEIEIHVGGSAHKVDKFVELLKQLLSNIWSTTTLVKLKSVEMNMLCPDSPLSDELCKKIRGMCPSNIRIKSNVFPEGLPQD